MGHRPGRIGDFGDVETFGFEPEREGAGACSWPVTPRQPASLADADDNSSALHRPLHAGGSRRPGYDNTTSRFFTTRRRRRPSISIILDLQQRECAEHVWR